LGKLLPSQIEWVQMKEEKESLSIIVGEGTTRIMEYSSSSSSGETKHWNDLSRMVLGVMLQNVEADAGCVFAEDHRTGSAFFRYALMSFIYDTLDKSAGEWPVSCIKWIDPATGTLGVPHDKYVRGEGLAVPAPPVDRNTLKAMQYLEKFEHPSGPLALSGSTDEALFQQRSKTVTECVQTINAALPNRNTDRSSDVYFSLWELHPGALEQIRQNLLSNKKFLSKVSLRFERVCDAVVDAVFTLYFV
jgi:hypothetical protein